MAQAPAAPPASSPAAAPSTPAAAAAAPTAAPAAQPAGTPTPAPAEGEAPAAQPAPTTPPAEPAPPPPPPQYQTPPAEPPPAPRYPPLGGNKPEPEVEKGDWDPWEHVGESKHSHDGFMLRLTIGIGFGGAGGDDFAFRDRGKEVAVAGAGLNFEVAIGGALTDNLVLNADLFQATMFNPTVEVDGEELGDADDLEQDYSIGEDTELTGIGIGVTYYFMPVNLYLAGSIGIGKIIFVDGSGDRGGSDVGFATNLMIGKEWWVGTDWGIGVAGQMILIGAEDRDLGDVGGIDFGVLFSATYN